MVDQDLYEGEDGEAERKDWPRTPEDETKTPGEEKPPTGQSESSCKDIATAG